MALTKQEITQYINLNFPNDQQSRALAHLFKRLADDPTNVTTSTYTVQADDTLISLNRAAGIAVLLPAATGTGRKLSFFVPTTLTGNVTIDTIGTDIMQGMAIFNADSTGDVTYSFPTTSSTDTLTMFTASGGTTGGLAGARVDLQDVASGVWSVIYVSEAGGTEVTPFS